MSAPARPMMTPVPRARPWLVRFSDRSLLRPTSQHSKAQSKSWRCVDIENRAAVGSAAKWEKDKQQKQDGPLPLGKRAVRLKLEVVNEREAPNRSVAITEVTTELVRFVADEQTKRVPRPVADVGVKPDRHRGQALVS